MRSRVDPQLLQLLFGACGKGLPDRREEAARAFDQDDVRIAWVIGRKSG